ncbi:thiolase family protein, partial [Streptomyces formicae]
MRDAVIIGAVRSAVGRRNGGFSDVHPVDLSAKVLQGLVERTGLAPGEVDDVIWGCFTPDWTFFPSTLHWSNLSELFDDPTVPMARSL